MPTNFLDISYLKLGNLKQQKSYDILVRLNLFSILSDYSPVLAGTIPIGIDLAESDLDIVCEVTDLTRFSQLLQQEFGHESCFRIRYRDKETIVCNFMSEGMEIEIFASPQKVLESRGYRHMLIEHRILTLFGADFKEKIIELKQSGFKTEPAFANLLKLDGDPYEQLLLLEDYSDMQLQNRITVKS